MRGYGLALKSCFVTGHTYVMGLVIFDFSTEK